MLAPSKSFGDSIVRVKGLLGSSYKSVLQERAAKPRKDYNDNSVVQQCCWVRTHAVQPLSMALL